MYLFNNNASQVVAYEDQRTALCRPICQSVLARISVNRPLNVRDTHVVRFSLGTELVQQFESRVPDFGGQDALLTFEAVTKGHDTGVTEMIGE